MKGIGVDFLAMPRALVSEKCVHRHRLATGQTSHIPDKPRSHYVRYNTCGICVGFDQGSLIALIEVPTNVASSDDAAHHGRHIADNNCLAQGKGSKTQIKPFYDFERRRELDGGAVEKECCYAINKGSPQIRREGRYANVIFESGKSRVFRSG